MEHSSQKSAGAAVEIRNISKYFDSNDGVRVIALENVSLDIQAGEFIALVGPSGCGKSTLMRMIAGLIKPSAGTITINHERFNGPREDSGVVFQAATLLPWATVLENICFSVQLKGQPITDEHRAKAQALIEIAGLQGFEGKQPKELSGGMQQRVAICRALFKDPDLLLMDEPFGALDALTREEMTLELLRIWAQTQKTIVFVTHSISEAVLLADRVVVMSPRPGRIAQVLEVQLPRPRSFAMSSLPEFAACSDRIRQLIFQRQQVYAHD